jgi:hypothetical protein
MGVDAGDGEVSEHVAQQRVAALRRRHALEQNPI